jgi:hypothetical protein
MKRLPFWKRPHGARRVLDIGSGHNPFHGATHLLEIDLQEGRERGGKQVHVPESTTLTVGDISALPYRTGSFDYVYASHILEHVTDPIVACREIMRAGRAGYVETPAPFLEQGLAHYDKTPPDQWFHRWFVFVDRQQQLVFEPKTPDEVDRFCSCRAGQFMKEFYDSVDYREAQHCFPSHAKRSVLYWRGSFVSDVRTHTVDCRREQKPCRFDNMLAGLVRGCNDVFRAPRLLSLRRKFPACVSVFQKYGVATLFVR